MHAQKLHRLRAERPSVASTAVRGATESERQRIKAILRGRLGLSESVNDLSLTKSLRQRLSALPGLDALAVGFSLPMAFRAAGISPEARVFVNWHRFDDVDDVEFHELAEHFEYFWYPKADDIDLLDRTGHWVLSIDCDGTVWAATL